MFGNSEAAKAARLLLCTSSLWKARVSPEKPGSLTGRACQAAGSTLPTPAAPRRHQPGKAGAGGDGEGEAAVEGEAGKLHGSPLGRAF